MYVCLFVCQQDHLQSSELICMVPLPEVLLGTRNHPIKFGNYNPETDFFSVTGRISKATPILPPQPRRAGDKKGKKLFRRKYLLDISEGYRAYLR